MPVHLSPKIPGKFKKPKAKATPRRHIVAIDPSLWAAPLHRQQVAENPTAITNTDALTEDSPK